MLTDYSKRTTVGSIHRAALDIAEDIAYSRDLIFEQSRIGSCDWIPISAEYKIKAIVTDLDNNRKWECGTDANYSVFVSLPILIEDNGLHSSGLLEVGVKRK
ncbi:MAG: hypothetical protein J7K68_01830 [Candidatus Diapherotrites archaeon]|nr:hypothetical protein [Candidatus Diapherotrites archaeon]